MTDWKVFCHLNKFEQWEYKGIRFKLLFKIAPSMTYTIHRPLMCDLNKSPCNYTVEVTNRFKD